MSETTKEPYDFEDEGRLGEEPGSVLTEPCDEASDAPAIDAPTGDEAQGTEPLGEPCPKCQEPTFVPGAEWCSRCGFYPRLNIFVEPDPEETQATSNSDNPWKQIPLWAWQLGAGVAVLAVAAVAARLATPDDSMARTICALSLLGAGALAVIVAHVVAYVAAIFSDGQMGVFDLFLKPLSVWGPTFNRFPDTFPRVASAGWGLSAMFFAVVVIGNIPYSKLWDFGDAEPAKVNLVKAIASSGFEAEEADGDLEGAIEEFAGQANPQPSTSETPKPKSRDEAELAQRPKSIDCVVLGYIPAGDDDLQSLVLGGDVQGQLRIVAVLREGIPPDEKQQLMADLRAIPLDRPFLSTNIEAEWVEPRIAVRVRFRDWNRSRLRSPYFDKRLADLRP